MAAADIEALLATQLAKRPAADVVELQEDDEGRAASLFLGMQTQWHFASAGLIGGSGGGAIRAGLRYEALPVVAGAHGVQLDSRVLADLAEIESAVLRADADARSGGARK